jgi:hypothetical protein
MSTRSHGLRLPINPEYLFIYPFLTPQETMRLHYKGQSVNTVTAVYSGNETRYLDTCVSKIRCSFNVKAGSIYCIVATTLWRVNIHIFLAMYEVCMSRYWAQNKKIYAANVHLNWIWDWGSSRPLISTGCELDDRRVGVRVPVGSEMLSSRRPDRFWGPPSFIHNGYRRLFHGG